MSDPNSAPTPEDLGYFYDTIHGRIALEELPAGFRPALKSALSSKTLARLKRISQLGHTSLSFFSATHTRFSHAIGTMLVMNDLFQHVCKQEGLSDSVFDEAKEHFSESAAHFGDARVMVHCHLLVAALYQDTGELPFQKVSSLHFVPIEGEVNFLVNELPNAKPRQWSTKKVFSVLSLLSDFSVDGLKAGFAGYDREFLAYLITGDGAPSGTKAISALLQLLDGVVDADRLDYVYRDASVTIGSLSRPSTVLESVVGYEPGHVIVNDPRPVTDFLSTRMRLWTFVYSSADVRFRQALLKTVLDGRWDSERTEAAFRQDETNLDPELSHKKFLALDDISLMDRVERIDPAIFVAPYRSRARDLLIRGTLDYECRILKRGELDVVTTATSASRELPADMFFDLLSDHGDHQLYRTGSILVRQALTSKIADAVKLEDSAGAFSPLFSGKNSAVLVPHGYYVFLPRARQGGHWPDVKQAMEAETLYPLVVWENARRGIPPTDTRNKPAFNVGKAMSISFCSKDFPVVVRIVRELHRQRRPYRLFLRPFDGIGETPAGNSGDLIEDAEAVLMIVSTDYLKRASDGKTYIAIEVRAMHDRAMDIPIVPLGVDRRSELETVPNWDWAQVNESWRKDPPVFSEELPLRNASEETLRAEITEALNKTDQWKKR
jgi:HD superfamily phosphohydrolase